ncbi:MAG: bifunctional isocitrate dehydrogenase kinase/phosphatase, partial [Sinobacteraceae bacterium]|nr:bifunctional isocitrate dehydrogenase kinase/phosphatase [Nevskiaceae bacterium]
MTESAAVSADALLESSAQRIAAAFAAYNGEFRTITRRAKTRFEARDWQGSQQDAVERIDLYDKSVNRLVEALRGHLGERAQDRTLWHGIRNRFHSRTAGLPDAAFARTFFSSVSRRLLGTVGVAPELEFTGDDLDPLEGAGANPEIIEYGFRGDLHLLLEDLLGNLELRCPWINFDRSVAHAVQDIEAALGNRMGQSRLLSVKVFKPIFFQSTRAYIVGHLATDIDTLPLAIALQHTERGLFIDAVMLDEDDVSVVFGFTRSYFHADLERVIEAVVFLRQLLPRKPLSELFTVLGRAKQGKTERFREVTRHLEQSDDQFVHAAGERGLVMVCFTLPSLDVVFK